MIYDTMEKAKEQAKVKYGHLKEGWNENPSNAMQYPSLESDEVKAEAEAMHEKVMQKRRDDFANGRGEIPTIMYPSMCNISAGEVKAAMAAEDKQREIDIWNEANRIADERNQ
jgi:hypothetical protein